MDSLEQRATVKTTTVIDKALLEDIDQVNPFKTRREFFEHACRYYLRDLRKKWIDEQLENACRQSADEDEAINSEWENITLETWK